MNEEYLVAQLADRASKILLVLLLARKLDPGFTNRKFAKMTGARSSQFDALASLVEAGVIDIISQEGQPCLVQVLLPFCGIVPLEGEVPLAPPEAALSPLEQCRVADEQKDRKAQVEALRRVWDEAFPMSDYPYQRLSDDAAKKFLANGKASSDVARVILDAPAHATKPIQSPRAYVEAALSRAEKHRGAENPEAEITDDLRLLVKIGRNQHAAENK